METSRCRKSFFVLTFLFLSLLGIGVLKGCFGLYLLYGGIAFAPGFLITFIFWGINRQRIWEEALVINKDLDAKCASCGSLLGMGVTRCWHCDRALERGVPSYQPDYRAHPREIESQTRLPEPKIIDSSQELENLRRSYRKVFRK